MLLAFYIMTQELYKIWIKINFLNLIRMHFIIKNQYSNNDLKPKVNITKALEGIGQNADVWKWKEF